METNNQNPKTNTLASAAPKKIDVLKGILNAQSVQEQFRNALKENSNTFIASVIDLYNNDTDLQKCEPKAVVMEALKAAVLHLPINKALGFAYVVVYNNKKQLADGSWTKAPTPTFMPGYKGYIQLAMRTGQYRTINADLVYEGEVRKVNKLTGEIAFDGQKVSDKIVGYFCYFELLNGFSKTLYMPVNDMASYAKRYSKSVKKETTAEMLEKLANPESGIFVASNKLGWEGNFNDMGLKTVIRRLLSKYGYLSIEMQTAMESDNDIGNDRDDTIAEHANTKELAIQDVSFVDVNNTQNNEEPPATESVPY
ncbi:MAG: recombinase RecT [Cytophagaceae bacterium]|jgi:recombination protein RecT|nr:recombinase RecT [Cytophagaceae bacterium]